MPHLTAVAILFVVSVSAAPSPDGTGGPRLDGEVSVFSEDDDRWRFNPRTYWPLMRLSPDGLRLLWLRQTKEYGNLFALTLRDLATGEDQPVPIPPVTLEWANVYPRIEPFDCSGKRMVLARFDGDSQERSRIILWELDKKEPTDVELEGRFVYGKYDRTGTRLILNVRQQLWIAPFPKLELKPTGVSAILFSRCPTQDLIAVYTVQRAPGLERPRDQLILYDLNSQKQRDALPLDNGTWLDDLETKWTSDGRYLYYADPPVVKVWDCMAQKLVASIDASYPVGPGPTESTMVLKRVRTPAEFLSDTEFRNIVVHNAATGGTWDLGDRSLEIQDARAGRVVYLKHHPNGGATVHMARIVMPTRD